MCTHEMDRAIALDPGFVRDIIVPVRRDDVAMPATIKPSLYVDLRDEMRAGASLVPLMQHWLRERG